MSSSLLDDEARIQLAIQALEAGICKNPWQQSYPKFRTNVFKLNGKVNLLALEVKQRIKYYQMQKKLQFVIILIN